MKTFTCTVALATVLLTQPPNTYALCGHVAAERERRQAAEQQLVREQQTTGQLVHTNEGLHTAVSALSAAAALALVIGAALGSKTRRDARQP